jgi:predicted NodU family carbamoyl transferase
MHLLLTLGHNSSAIGITANDLVCGYEQERLDRIKSSSAFPCDAIDLIGSNLTEHESKMIFVSHWFDNFKFHSNQFYRISKYYDYSAMDAFKREYEIVHLSPQLTHHDAHAWSAVSFFETHWTGGNVDAHIIVADGFGNCQEVVSIYKMTGTGHDFKVKKIAARHGYTASLGLLYQYATAFCGMTENQDEYKFLGYESNITDVCSDHEISKLDDFATTVSSVLKSNSKDMPFKESEWINQSDLSATRAEFYKIFNSALSLISTSRHVMSLRTVIGYFIQKTLETYYTNLIQEFNISNVLLAGGVHYNVKLNNLVSKLVSGFISIVPLAGDQGAAIGLRRSRGYSFPFKGLLWGHRNLTISKANLALPRYVEYTKNVDHYIDLVCELLSNNRLVNIITGSMEFGPRALCNTSTLALPTAENVQLINVLNGRNTVMPFAGVMLDSNASYFHDEKDIEKIIGSTRYMITTMDYKSDVDTYMYRGIMHSHPTLSMFTGRPQLVTRHSVIGQILSRLDTKALINTSLNVHGVPIVFSTKQALTDYGYNLDQAKRLNTAPPVLVIGDFKDQ